MDHMDNMDIMYIVGELIETLTFVIREVKANRLELEAQNKHIENCDEYQTTLSI